MEGVRDVGASKIERDRQRKRERERERVSEGERETPLTHPT